MISALPNVPRSESILYLLVLYEKILWKKISAYNSDFSNGMLLGYQVFLFNNKMY